MPSSCCVVGCRSRGNTPQGIQFFQLPLNRPKVLTQWLIVLDRRDWIPKSSSRICSLHFSSDDYLQRVNQNVARLKPEAIPSLFPDLNNSQDESELPSPKSKDDSTTTEDVKASVISRNLGDLSTNATPSPFIDTPRPRRVSKLNVKMKDFILLDDIKKQRLNSPASELQNIIPQPSEKEKAAQELLSILEDSNSLSGNESEKDSNNLGNLNDTLNKLHSNINNSQKIVLLSKKGSKEDISSSTAVKVKPKVVPMPGVKPGPKSSKKKLADGISSKVDGSHMNTDALEDGVPIKTTTQESLASSNSQENIKKSDAPKKISARKKTYQIKDGGRYYYFNYSDLNPIVDMSKDNQCKEYISTQVSEREPAAIGVNSEVTEQPEVDDIEQESSDNMPTEKSDMEHDVSVVSNSEILTEGTNDLDVPLSPQSESGSVEFLPVTKTAKRKRPVRKNNRKPMTKTRVYKKRKTSLGKGIVPKKNDEHEGSINNNQVEKNITAESGNPLQTDEGLGAVSSDNEVSTFEHMEAVDQLVSVKRLGSPSSKVKNSSPLRPLKRKKRFKTVAEIVVRTDTTGQVPSVSIDKIVDLESSETPPLKKAKTRRTRTRYFPSSELSTSSCTDLISKSSGEDELNILSSQIVDTIKKMKHIEDVKGHASKLTVLIATLPPVEVNELLVIKKKNVKTNAEQSRELKVAISNYKNTDGTTSGNTDGVANCLDDNFVPIIAAYNKDIDDEVNERAVINGDVNQIPPDSDGSSENRDPNVANGNFQSVNCPLKVNSGQLENDIIENNGEISEGVETAVPIRHDHTYISPSLKIIGDIDIINDDQFKETFSKMKLSDEEIMYRNKVHRKVRSLKENVKRKNESILKLKEKIKFLEKTIREERKTKRRLVKHKSRTLGSDTLYTSMVDSDITDAVDYSSLNNVELPLQFEENMEDSESESKGCSSPITYLCEPAIDICEDAAPDE